MHVYHCAGVTPLRTPHVGLSMQHRDQCGRSHHQCQDNANESRSSPRLREQVDLDALTAELLAVVDRTVQPTHASLWLRPPARPRSPR
jgi:hypothetical protein